MEKEELIKKIDSFMDQAQQANSYFLIVKQFLENKNKFYEEMAISSAFYSYTYNALVVASFMELAKIYDTHNRSTNIQKLVKECKDNISYFPTYNTQHKEIIDGKKHVFTSPFYHTIKKDEEEFFQKEIEYKKVSQEILSDEDYSMNVEMTISRYFEYFEWRLTRLQPKLDKLFKQRNKIYAHNDEQSIKNIDAIINKFPLDYSEINKLILFALEFCQFSYALLTGINKPSSPINISDWTNTLMLVQVGLKYQELEIQKLMD